MKSGIPWRLRGVGQEARETAREAARRAGMSVGEWLDTVILGSTEDASEEPERSSHRHHAPHHAERREAELASRLPLAGVREQRPVPRREDVRIEESFASLNARLDNLSRELAEVARASAANARRSEPKHEAPPRQWIEAIAKLDRRLDQLVAEGRSTKSEMEQRVSAVGQAVAELHRERTSPRSEPAPATPLDQALVEIADRQRTLNGYPTPARAAAAASAAPASESLPRARTQELSGLEQQLRQINAQIEKLARPCGIDKAVDTIRDDLAEIGAMVQQAMPRAGVEAIERDIRKLADRIEQNRSAGADDTALAGIERGLGEVRDALRGLAPAENLLALDGALQQLSDKIDLIAHSSQDPGALKQLEAAIIAMRGIVSQVASNDALASLSDEVRALAGKVDRAAAPESGHALSALEHRIAALADALEMRNQGGQRVPDQLEAVINGLVHKIERIQLTNSDQAALGHLEDRIVALVEKLDASDARLNHLEAIERGLAELLIHLEHNRGGGLGGQEPVSSPEMNLLSRDVADLRQTERKTLESLEVVHGTLGHVVDRLAMIETDMRRPGASQPAPAPAMPSSSPVPKSAPAKRAAPPKDVKPPPLAIGPLDTVGHATGLDGEPPDIFEDDRSPRAMPAAERRVIDPSLPPDFPLEPGSGVDRRRAGPASPAQRIAASEAALAGTKPAPTSDTTAGKANFIAAARRAAQTAGREAAGKPRASGAGGTASIVGKLVSRVAKLRSLIAGTSGVLIVVGGVQVLSHFLYSSEEPTAVTADVPAQTESLPRQEPVGSVAPAEVREPGPVEQPQIGRQSSAGASIPVMQSPDIVPPPEAGRPAVPLTPQLASNSAGTAEPEITGSIAGQALPSKPAASPGPATTSPVPVPAAAGQSGGPAASAALDKLPAALGVNLRAAAIKGQAAAQYEVGLRFAEGHGVPQNFLEAADWLDRAAKQGVAPAQFRLGGLYEKGLGVKKNLDAARRFYLAAGEAGNAKALHNLAVLYAEGIDGRPDYQSAAKWFRRAAAYGITDSQYNLAILYARGIGVEQNLTEAYKWFSLAAHDGDAESARKRDEIRARLDADSLAAANQAVQGWAPQSQPDAAIQVKSPPGGWDAAPVPVVSAKHKPGAVGPKLDLATPPAAQ
jgi:localization factor PodJL